MPNSSSKNLVKRSPVVCIMGHIDHGKSTLLDYIRKTNIVDSEAGGITQRISAYEVLHTMPDGREERITFLDTPGHEAFSAMRLSGTSVADIAVLVVSAEDGVKKQTIEAWKAIEDAHIPAIIAINKIDKPDANIEKTKASLTENGIYIEGYGGTVPSVAISAKKGTHVDELLDIILLVAEMAELKGDPKKPASGMVVEAHLDKQKGITSVVIVKDGTLTSGMYVVSGSAIAPTRIMEDFRGKKIKEAVFSSPVRIIGFDKLPDVGKPFASFETKKEAEAFAEAEMEKERAEKSSAKKPAPNAEEESAEETTPTIRVMLKAAVAGALAAIRHEIGKIKTDKVKIKIVGENIGTISENDVKLASGRNPAIILGFDVGVDATTKDLAERQGIVIKTFDIIYKISEWLAEEVKKRTPKTFVEETTATAKVLKVFSSMKDKHILGGRVERGTFYTGEDAKVMRGTAEVGRGRIRELQQAKNTVNEVREGVEFGCQFQSDVTPAPGDKIEIFRVIEQ
ncbi:MAG: translation initiation factor IF-2 [Patescibacteria group bacterium]|nr:translation initiation factor IF-2 [Patescibacteria group bacterium]MDE1946175.1 translation initiation factor IF-2 [Patescibacteria group bacterium]